MPQEWLRSAKRAPRSRFLAPKLSDNYPLICHITVKRRALAGICIHIFETPSEDCRSGDATQQSLESSRML